MRWRQIRVAVGAVGLLAVVAIVACGDDGGPTEQTKTGKPEIALRELATFNSPLGVYQPPGEAELLLVPEKRGVIRVLRGDKPLRRPFLDLRRYVTFEGTEQGLTGIAFPPNYNRSGRFYVSYTAERKGELRVEEFRRSSKQATTARAGTRRTVLTIPQPDPIHNGGQLQFGADGYLYIGVGDGGPSYDPDNRGQDLNSLLGKLLRIDPRRQGPGRAYGIPKGNPFRGSGRGEIYAYGLRNPWRFSFDRRTGAIWIGDVGQDQIEEINTLGPRRLRGANLGWSGYEGTLPFKKSQQADNALDPFHEYLHEGRCSVTGGYVVHDRKLSRLKGLYIYGDFCDGQIRALSLPRGGKKRDHRVGLEVSALVSFGEDERGRIYAVSLDGPIYRLVERSTAR